MNILTLPSQDPLSNILLFLFIILLLLIIYLANKLRTIQSLRSTVEELNQTVESLDHQAQLIIKSDIELKLYQEEIEDKLNKLTLLKNLIISSINVLDKEQLFYQIDEKTVNDLGFRRGLILTYDDLNTKVNVGFGEFEIEAVRDPLRHRKGILKLTSLLAENSDLSKELTGALATKNVLVAPIKARENIYAIFLLADYNLPTEIKTAEKEIFTIICMYLGQCLDNIRLFEDLYRAKDELELKIKERTNELVKSLREIEKISKTKSDFISGVSHELRTPLTSVKGFSSLLIEEKFGKLPPEAKERLKKIDENVDKLVEMVNTLLDISRIESGKVEVKIAPSDIVKLTKDVGDFLEPQIHSKNIKLGINAPEALSVYIDKNLIERVLINLINNAIKFTPQGGQIKIVCEKQGNQATISVQDNGCGIDKENINKLFQEFFRVDNPVNREMRGSGLGLSLVKRIIDIHKEKIWVESEVGKGTTFYFTLKI